MEKAQAVDKTEFPEIRHPKKRAFLSTYAKIGIIGIAAAAAGIDRRTHSNWQKNDEAFASAFETAREMACDRMEQEAWRRAMQGTEKPVFYKGDECGRIREYSDTLLIFMLKANRPHKFRDNLSISGPDGGAIRSVVYLATEAECAAEWEKECAERLDSTARPTI
jgi:hypothetical protein